MKNYKKDYDKYSIGSSDMACVLCAGMISTGSEYWECELSTAWINFGEDGDYKAYIVDAECEIPAHYQLAHKFESWLTVYDDDECVFKAHADKINIYRAGSFGVIIQLIGERAEFRPFNYNCYINDFHRSATIEAEQ